MTYFTPCFTNLRDIPDAWHYRHSFPVLDGDEWSASRSGCFITVERYSYIHWTKGWMGSRVYLIWMDSGLCQERNSGRQST